MQFAGFESRKLQEGNLGIVRETTAAFVQQ